MVILAASRLTGPDYFILTGYFVLMLGIGAYFYKYMKGMRDYFTGGNRIPWWLSGVSFYMSCFSAFGFIAYSELAYKYGLVSITIWWFGIPAFILSVLLFGRRWRRMRITSPVEYLENRYSTMTRQLFAWEGLPVRIIDDALKIVAIGIFVSRAFYTILNQMQKAKTKCLVVTSEKSKPLGLITIFNIFHCLIRQPHTRKPAKKFNPVSIIKSIELRKKNSASTYINEFLQ